MVTLLRARSPHSIVQSNHCNYTGSFDCVRLRRPSLKMTTLGFGYSLSKSLYLACFTRASALRNSANAFDPLSAVLIIASTSAATSAFNCLLAETNLR
jgi:hypothetical protein